MSKEKAIREALRAIVCQREVGVRRVAFCRWGATNLVEEADNPLASRENTAELLELGNLFEVTARLMGTDGALAVKAERGGVVIVAVSPGSLLVGELPIYGKLGIAMTVLSQVASEIRGVLQDSGED